MSFNYCATTSEHFIANNFYCYEFIMCQYVCHNEINHVGCFFKIYEFCQKKKKLFEIPSKIQVLLYLDWGVPTFQILCFLLLFTILRQTQYLCSGMCHQWHQLCIIKRCIHYNILLYYLLLFCVGRYYITIL